MQMAEDLLDNCDLTPQDIGACARGRRTRQLYGRAHRRGSAKGLCLGLQLPCYGVSTLEAMTRGAAYADGVIYCACMDARKRAGLQRDSLQAGKLTRLTDDA